MSRRFGRNQRRRAREQLAQVQAQAQVQLTNGQLQLDAVSRKLREARRQIEEAQRRLGQYTYMLEPRSISISREPFGHSPEAIQVDRLETWSEPDGDFQMGWRQGTHYATVRREPLPVMVARAKLEPQTGAMHIKVRYGNGQWGYGISPEVFRFESRDALAGIIARELAELITRDMQLEGSKVR